MNDKDKLEYLILKDLQEKASQGYCTNKILCGLVHDKSYDECKKCLNPFERFGQNCKSYDNFGEYPLGFLGEVYYIILNYKK